MILEQANVTIQKARLMVSYRYVLATLTVMLLALVATSPADADIRLDGFETAFSSSEAGNTADYNMKFEIGRVDPENPSSYPSGVIKDLQVDLPTGFVSDPTAAATCPMARVNGQGIARCPVESVVGVALLRLFNPTSRTVLGPYTVRVYRLEAQNGEAAAFGFNTLLAYAVRLSATVDPSNGYRVRMSSRNQQAGVPLIQADVTMWGVPAEHQGPGALNELGYPSSFGGPMPAATRRERFGSVPGRCDVEATTSMRMASWQHQTMLEPVDASAGMPSGCDDLPFSPAFEISPSETEAGVPSAFNAVLRLGQSTDPAAPRTPNLKDAEVNLPEGVSLSPSFANGLEACTDEQLEIDSATRESCPAASKIGEAVLESPVLDEPVRGEIFTGAQISQDPASGKMFRIFVVGTASGVKVKLEGEIAVDPDTGQITARFLDNPDLPLERMTLKFKGGQRAPMVTPETCGTYSTESSFTSWAGQQVEVRDTFEITSGAGGKPCPTDLAERPFNPKLNAGVANPVAGSSSPFVFQLTREDGDQEILSTTVTPPQGVTAKLAGIPYCSEQDIAANSCKEASRIGTEIAGAGAGSSPFYTTQNPGKVYLAGPYKGAPLSMVIQEPVIAGPFDLKDITVRAQIHVDPRTAQLTVISDPIPQVNSGVPLRVRDLRIRMDRPDFTIAPTNCDPMSVGAEVQGSHGATANLTNRFQVGDCGSLGFHPNLDLSFGNSKKNTKPNSHPPLNAKLSFNEGDANISSVEVALPQGLFLDQDRLGRICSRANYAAETCPEESIVGYAKATTPLLDEPVEGPVYLKASDNPLPDLAADLNGQIDVDLFGKIDQKQNKKGLNQIRNTFDIVPDVPVSDFELTLDGGADGLLVNSRNICKSKKAQKVSIDMVAHNEMTSSSKPLIGSACKQLNKKKAKKLKAKAKKLLRKAKKADDNRKAKQLRKQARKLKRQARKLGR